MIADNGLGSPASRRPRPRLLVVLPAPPRPVSSGGRLRSARVVAALREAFDVVVVYPVRGPYEMTHDLSDVPLLGWSRPGRLRRFSTVLLRRGSFDSTDIWNRRTRHQLRAVVRHASPDFVFWFSAPAFVAGSAPERATIVEFEDIDEERHRSFAERATSRRDRIVGTLESVSARRWERRVIRRSALTVALGPSDAHALERRGAHVIQFPNGIESKNPPRSPLSAPRILTVASWDYPANLDGLRRFLEDDWAAIRQAHPGTVLDVVGRGGDEFVTLISAHATEGVVAHGWVDSLDAMYERATVVLAPAMSGGGSQVKLTEAIGHGRLVAGPLHLSRECTGGREEFLFPSVDVAGTMIGLLRDHARRHELETRMAQFCRDHSWNAEAAELVEWIRCRHQVCEG